MNSVQQYVRGLLDGLAIPGSTTPLKAWVTPPTVETLTGPLAWVGTPRMVGDRESMPRGQGFKKLKWTVAVYLALALNPNTPNLDQLFPLAADAIMIKLWTTTMPIPITDPTTGMQTRMMSIGEQFTLDAPPVHTLKTQRMLYYTARINFQVQELPQA